MTSLIDLALPYQKRFILAPQRKKILCSSRQIGKSWTLAFIAAYKALQKKNGLSLCISTGGRAAAELMKKVHQFAEATKLLSKGAITYMPGADSCKFSNGARVISLPSGNPTSLRGWSANCVLIDECAFIERPYEVMQSIAPTLTRDKDSELIVASSPAGKNGLFWDLWNECDEGTYVQTTTIYDATADGLAVDIDELKKLCPDPDIFAQEYECKFLAEYGSMIDTNLIDWYDDDPPGIDGRYLGMDIGSRQDRSAITTLLTKGDCVYVSDIAILNKVEYERQLQIVKEMNDKHHYNAGLIDETGIGSAFAAFVSKNVSSLLKGLIFSSSNKTPMYERLRSMIFQHKLFINRRLKPLIVQDFNNVQRVVTESGKVQYIAGHNEQGHSDATSSLVLALEAQHQHPIQMSAPVSYALPSAFGGWQRRF